MTKILDKYDNDILELPLVVSIYSDLEDLQKEYSYSGGDELDDKLVETSGSCCVLSEKKTKKLVIFVGINHIPSYVKKYNKNDRDSWIINTITHECYHAFMDSMNIIQETPCTEHQELAAYYMGWLAECVYKSWVKSTKSKKSDAK